MSNPWTSFYWRDYIADTGHLSLTQHGAYLQLMCHYYLTSKPIPADASLLYRVCRCTTEADRQAVDQVLLEFFVRDGEVYRHRRIDKELGKAVEISGKRRAAALGRHQKDRAIAYVDAAQLHTQPQPQSQIQEQDQKNTSEPPEGSDASSEDVCAAVCNDEAQTLHLALSELIEEDDPSIPPTEKVFEYFVSSRGARQLTLTPGRRKMFEKRWTERFRLHRRAGLDPSEARKSANRDVKEAIDALLSSQWHWENKQLRWELIFRSLEKFEERLPDEDARFRRDGVSAKEADA